jgi:hypothetical protein
MRAPGDAAVGHRPRPHVSLGNALEHEQASPGPKDGPSHRSGSFVVAT